MHNVHKVDVFVPVLLIAVLGMLLLAFAFIVWFGLSLARLLFRQVLDPLAGRATGSLSRRGRAERDGRRSSPRRPRAVMTALLCGKLGYRGVVFAKLAHAL